MNTDDILRRFEARTAEAKDKPARPQEPAPQPIKIGKRAPTDADSVKILTVAAKLAEEVALDYGEKSPERTALTVLARFAKDMIS